MCAGLPFAMLGMIEKTMQNMGDPTMVSWHCIGVQGVQEDWIGWELIELHQKHNPDKIILPSIAFRSFSAVSCSLESRLLLAGFSGLVLCNIPSSHHQNNIKLIESTIDRIRD